MKVNMLKGLRKQAFFCRVSFAFSVVISYHFNKLTRRLLL